MTSTFRQINVDARNRTTEYVVKTGDSALVESLIGVSIGSPHPEDSGIYCTSITSNEIEPRVWVVTCNYETVVYCELVDPTTCPPEISWTTEKKEEVLKTDVDGNDVLNTVNDEFQPLPTRLKSRVVLTVTYNTASFSGATALALDSKVNSAPYSGAAAKTLLSSIESATRQYHSIIEFYWVVRVKLTYNEDVWNPMTILNTGMRRPDPDDSAKKKLILIKGREVTSPVPLSSASVPLEVTDALHYVEFTPYCKNRQRDLS
jgi:hypothetical protein